MKSFVAHIPHSERLRRYISHYYFHSASADEAVVAFNYYPHLNHALTLYRDSEIVQVSAYHTRAQPGMGRQGFMYTHLIDHFAHAELVPPFEKAGVVFKPLGLNHFVDRSLGTVLEGHFNLDFDGFSRRQNALPGVFDLAEVEQRVALLDDFFEANLVGLAEQRMTQAVGLMLEEEADWSIAELAEELGMGRKTLTRMFQEHLACSPRDYKRLIRFRRAVSQFEQATAGKSLTELSLDSQYYDQSDFIKHFNALTGFSPKHFFRSVTDFGNSGTIWMEVEQG